MVTPCAGRSTTSIRSPAWTVARAGPPAGRRRAGSPRAKRLTQCGSRHLGLEGRARDAAERGLQHQLVADPPLLADHRAVHVDAGRGQVLAEQAARQLPAELLLPPVVVLAGVRVDRLVVAAVVLDVEDLVADQAAVQPGGLRARARAPATGWSTGCLLMPVMPTFLAVLRLRDRQVDREDLPALMT